MKHISTIGLLAAFTVVSVGSVAADMFVYPKKGQSKDQQQKDQYECHLWAVEQTGVDPMKPAQPAPATAQSGGGEVVHGAAKGAALGAIVVEGDPQIAGGAELAIEADQLGEVVPHVAGAH